MEKVKVYLAKVGNDYDLIAKVRKKLKQNGLEVIEYQGSHYLDKGISECLYMVVVPDMAKVKNMAGRTYVNVNRELYLQIEFFNRMIENEFYGDKTTIGVIVHSDLTIGGFNELGLSDKSNYANTGFISISRTMSFDGFLTYSGINEEEEFEDDEDVIISGNNFHLLIKL